MHHGVAGLLHYGLLGLSRSMLNGLFMAVVLVEAGLYRPSNYTV